jgi:MFS family permease
MLLPQRFKPAGYTIASLAISLGGFLNGYDTGSIGAVVTMPQFRATVGDISPSTVGLTVSAIMFAGAIPSSLAGPPADKYGRTLIVAIGAFFFGVGAILQGAALSLAQFIAGRIFAGAGEGIFLGVLNV